jgi:hypothetical protein
VSLLDLTSGPRFQAFSGLFEDVTVKPLATFGAIWVNDSPYYLAYGAGVEVNALINDRLRNVTTAVWRKHDANDTSYLPTNSLFRGTEYTLNTIFPFELAPDISVFASGSAQRFQAEQAPWQSYRLLGFGGGLSFRFPDPLLRTGLPWTISFTASLQWWHYDSPDPVVDPTTYRDPAGLHQQSHLCRTVRRAHHLHTLRRPLRAVRLAAQLRVRQQQRDGRRKLALLTLGRVTRLSR